MRIADIMTPTVHLIGAKESVRSAALKMAEADCGALPVANDDRLVGMITDRDITTRVVATGLDPAKCSVASVMSPGVKYCFADDEAGEVAANMAEIQLRRLPVIDRDKRLVGMLSLGDMALKPESQGEAGEALSGIVQPT